MAKHRKSLTDKHPLPICSAMVICDSILLGQDGVVSIIRIVDLLTLSPGAEKAFKDAIALRQVNLFMLLKKGDSQGDFQLKMFSVGPSGKRTAMGEAPLNFETKQPESGRYISGPVALMWEGPGVYWVEVEVNGRRLGKCPIKIVTTQSENETPKSAKSKKSDR